MVLPVGIKVDVSPDDAAPRKVRYASLAVSLLKRHGFDNGLNLLGDMTAWSKLELPTSQGAERSVTTEDIEGERT